MDLGTAPSTTRIRQSATAANQDCELLWYQIRGAAWQTLRAGDALQVLTLVMVLPRKTPV